MRIALAPVFALAFAAPAFAQEPDIIPIPSPGVCVRGFSKLIEGELNGAWTSGGCIGPLNACRTAQSEAKVAWSFKSNPAGCEVGVACDESRDLGGRIAGQVKVNLRGQRPCPNRGAYEGRLEFTDAGGNVVATGRIQATLGVGTHQKPCVGPICAATPCETCYDVNFAQNTLRIGTEGFIDAPVTAGRYRGCRIRASIQGDFFVATTSPTAAPWKSRGNLDGVMECPCFVPDPVTPAE
jgi:hypothetical protein